MRNSGTFLTAYTQTYSEAGRAQSKLWPKGTLCVSIAANIAESAILGFDACFPDSVLGFAPNENVTDVLFVKYSLDQFRRVIERGSQSFVQENLSLERLEAIPRPRPPYAEQRRIAATLGTWDKAISTLGALIAAKQRRKQGLMQELLSKKRRFPECTEKWKEVRLGDDFDFRNGYNTSKEQYGSGVPFVNVLNVITHPALTPSTIKGKVNLPQAASRLDLEPDPHRCYHTDAGYRDVRDRRTRCFALFRSDPDLLSVGYGGCHPPGARSEERGITDEQPAVGDATAA